ncbi:MAG: redoxin domain-containing protein [Bacteroidota bacterium]
MSITVGVQAPNFTLTDTNKQPVTLSELKGHNVLLLFFPFAFTSTCTKELCGVRDDIANYTNFDAKVYGISVDAVYTLIKYKEDQALNFDLLSDFNKEASMAYESYYETFNFGMRGVSKRSAFLIDKEGIIQYAEVLENASEIPNLDAIKSLLQTINQ